MGKGRLSTAGLMRGKVETGESGQSRSDSCRARGSGWMWEWKRRKSQRASGGQIMTKNRLKEVEYGWRQIYICT